ncbi:MAG: DUF2723 domain-containing protein, partial [Paludibacteraceae bacterium]|nr:DUF2723 domain-containing protein [Paludibacteraceae bacterium]
MKEKTYCLINRIAGGLVFAIAMVVYGLTVEPTASFWDCSEFISSAAKMEVGHPPGAPFFMLTGKFFSLFASDPSQIAYMVNMMSAFLSALTIMLLFWTVTHMVRRVLQPAGGEGMEVWQVVTALGSGLVGALAYTFSDTFWFSAVEGEVYAYSSFLTAVVFWIILKWEKHADDSASDRYLIGIMYIMGVSIGVHLLNLLTIPAIVLVYYFRKWEHPTFKGMLAALAVSFAILALVLYGLIPGFVTMAGWFELFFVNHLHLPFNSGVLTYVLLAVASIVWALVELYRRQPNDFRVKISTILAFTMAGIPFLAGSVWVGVLLIMAAFLFLFLRKGNADVRILSTAVVSMAVMLIGYSSYAVLVVRSAANPPMDQNSPDNVFALKGYLNREQYGDRPLLYGAYYSAEPELVASGGYCKPKTIEGAKTYGKKEKADATERDAYVVTNTRYDLAYDSKFKTFFPRMHSSAGDHPKLYEDWIGGVKGKMVPYDRCGQQIKVKVPTFAENLRFFFIYQLNYMYWRYFLWNFSGRQNDMQGHGEVTNGNWITGFNFIDSLMLGDQYHLPPFLAENKGHNKYYMLPLLLGLIGIVWQLVSQKRGTQAFWVTFVLFFMTGIAIVLYLNQGPAEPRERDYAYAGSFYAFAIWIGFGVAGLVSVLSRLAGKQVAAPLATVLALTAPALMAAANWDDHDRSNRYVARDFGLNYFNSCAPNAIIFTNGDNDTFPLWYTQETEQTEVSLDKRVCNLSYLQTDWYIDQMRRPAYKSAALPIDWQRRTYVEGKRGVAYLFDLNGGEPLDLKLALDFLASDDPRTKIDPTTGSGYREYLPAKKFRVPVNVDNLIKQGAITEEQRDDVLPEMIIDLSNARYVTKAELMILDMLANNNWERPIYYAVTVGSEMYLGLEKYFQLEGLAFRIVPLKSAGAEGTVATDMMYDNMMSKFKFGNVSCPGIYLDENVQRMCS